MSRETSSTATPLRAAAVWCVVSAAGGTTTSILVPLVRPAPGDDFVDLLTAGCAGVLLWCVLWGWLAATVVVLDAVRGCSTRCPGCPGWLRRSVLAGCGVLLVGGPLATAHADPSAGQLPQPAPGSPPHLVEPRPVLTDVAGAVAHRAPTDHDLDGVPLPELPRTPPAPTAPTAPPTTRQPSEPAGPGTGTGREGAPQPDQTQPPAQPEQPEQPTRPGRPAQSPRSTPTAPEPPDLADVVVAPGDSLWSVTAAALPADASDVEVDQAWRTVWQHNRAVVGTDPDLIHPGDHLDLSPVTAPTTKEQQ